MKLGDTKKLTLFLAGMEARLAENRDYFSGLCMNFQSGRKSLSAQITRTESGFTLRYLGQVRSVTEREITAFFRDEVEKFDTAEWIYLERGRQWVISCSDRGVQMKQSEQTVELTSQPKNPLLGDRQYYIPLDRARELLQAIGILSIDGKLKNDKIRKYNQIDHYVELVSSFFQRDDSKEIFLLDCACGKSYLSFVLYYYITEVLHKKCRVLGIDISSGVIESSREIAKTLGYQKMEFITADLRNFVPPPQVTAVISLHACDIATDLALATAIAAKAKYIACVPCCHKELLDQFQLEPLEPLLRHGVFRARMNDLLTDSMRALKLEAAGYRVSAVEYISPIDTPKNLLIRAEWTGELNQKAEQEYQEIRAMLRTSSELDRRCEQNDWQDPFLH